MITNAISDQACQSLSQEEQESQFYSPASFQNLDLLVRDWPHF